MTKLLLTEYINMLETTIKDSANRSLDTRRGQTCYGNINFNDLDWLLLDTSEMLDKS